MFTKEQYNLLKLVRSENIGSATIHKLLQFYHSAEEIINHIDEINYNRKRQIKIAPDKQIKQELALLEKLGGQLLFINDDNYPENLRNIDDAPFVLSCIGDISLLNTQQIAIVGSRSVSQLGVRFTQKLAYELAEKGFTITSGLARGVDSLAHRGCLKANGKTIAVLGSSVDFVYPSENEELYKQIIAEGGLIISENQTGSGIVSKHQFPRRNRIISALSSAVVVTECTKRSGSLITARLALEMGKDLFAVPGHALDQHFEGTNDLLKQNCAFVLTETADVLAQVSLEPVAREQKREEKNAQYDLFDMSEAETEETSKQEETSDLESLIKNPISLDELVRRTGLPEFEVNSQVTMLELEGKLKRLDAGMVVSV